jgi:DNA replication protein DnaC
LELGLSRAGKFSALALARADGRYARTLRQIARLDLLILDDWGPETLNADQRRDLLEIIDDRHEMRSVIITSQVPVERWYEIIGDPTIADAILDRLVHNAYRIELTGESLLSVANRLHFTCGRHPASLPGLRARLSDWEPFAPLIVSLNS